MSTRALNSDTHRGQQNALVLYKDHSMVCNVILVRCAVYLRKWPVRLKDAKI